MARRRDGAALMAEDAPNAAQLAYWNESAGPVWADLQASLDHQLAPLGQRAMAALRPMPGEQILDIGCGSGETTLELADLVGKSGEVTGVDISRPLLEVARRRAANLTGVRFVEGDAQTYPFEPLAFDAAFSRFGVMFFCDPPAAFANIRRALRPGGRLAFVCWRSMTENPIMTAPLLAALQHVPPPPPPEPNAPGPFAFADAERVRGILQTAGFADIAFSPHDEKIGAGDIDESLALALKVGPLGMLLRENPDKRDAVVTAVRDVLAAHAGQDGVKLDSATWIVTARSPG